MMLMENLVAKANQEIQRHLKNDPQFCRPRLINMFFANFLIGSMCGLTRIECFNDYGVTSELIFLETHPNGSLASLKISLVEKETFVKLYLVDLTSQYEYGNQTLSNFNLQLFDEIILRQTSALKSYSFDAFLVKRSENHNIQGKFEFLEIIKIKESLRSRFENYRSNPDPLRKNTVENRLEILSCQKLHMETVQINSLLLDQRLMFQNTSLTLVRDILNTYVHTMEEHDVYSVKLRSVFAFFHGWLMLKLKKSDLSVSSKYLSHQYQIITVSPIEPGTSPLSLMITFTNRQTYEHLSAEQLENFLIWGDIFHVDFRQIQRQVVDFFGWKHVTQPNLLKPGYQLTHFDHQMARTLKTCCSGDTEQFTIESFVLGNFLSHRVKQGLNDSFGNQQTETNQYEIREKFNLDNKVDNSSQCFTHKHMLTNIDPDPWYMLKSIVTYCKIQNVNLYALVSGFFNNYCVVRKTQVYNILLLDNVNQDKVQVVQIQHFDSRESIQTIGDDISAFQSKFLTEIYPNVEPSTCCNLFVAIFIGDPFVTELIVEPVYFQLAKTCMFQITHENHDIDENSGNQASNRSMIDFSGRYMKYVKNMSLNNGKTIITEYSNVFINHVIETYKKLINEGFVTQINNFKISTDAVYSILGKLLSNTIYKSFGSSQDLVYQCLVGNLMVSQPKRENYITNSNMTLLASYILYNRYKTFKTKIASDHITELEIKVKYLSNHVESTERGFSHPKNFSYSDYQIIPTVSNQPNRKSILKNMLFILDHSKFNALYRSNADNINYESFLDMNQPLKHNDDEKIGSSSVNCSSFFYDEFLRTFVPLEIMKHCQNVLSLLHNNKNDTWTKILYEANNQYKDTIFAKNDTPAVFVIRSGSKNIRGSAYDDLFLIQNADNLEGKIDGLDGLDRVEFCDQFTVKNSVLTIGNYLSLFTIDSRKLFFYNIKPYNTGKVLDLINIETCDLDYLKVHSATISLKTPTGCVFRINLDVDETAQINLYNNLGSINYILHETTRLVSVSGFEETININQTFYLTNHHISDIVSFDMENSSLVEMQVGTTRIQIQLSLLTVDAHFNKDFILHINYEEAYFTANMDEPINSIINQVLPVASRLSLPFFIKSLKKSTLIFEPGKIPQNISTISYFSINPNNIENTIIVTSTNTNDKIFKIVEPRLFQCQELPSLTIYHKNETGLQEIEQLSILDLSTITSQIFYNIETSTRINVRQLIAADEKQPTFRLTVMASEKNTLSNLNQTCKIMQIHLKNITLDSLLCCWLLILDAEYKFALSETSKKLTMVPLAYYVEKTALAKHHLVLEAKMFMRLNVSEIGRDLALFWMDNDLVVTEMEKMDAPIILIRRARKIDNMQIDFLGEVDSVIKIRPEEMAEEIIVENSTINM